MTSEIEPELAISSSLKRQTRKKKYILGWEARWRI